MVCSFSTWWRGLPFLHGVQIAFTCTRDSQGAMQHVQSSTSSILTKLPYNLNFIYSIAISPNVIHKLTTPVCSINESISFSFSSVTLKESHPGSEHRLCWMNWSARTTSEDTEDYLQQPAWKTRDISVYSLPSYIFLGFICSVAHHLIQVDNVFGFFLLKDALWNFCVVLEDGCFVVLLADSISKGSWFIHFWFFNTGVSKTKLNSSLFVLRHR